MGAGGRGAAKGHAQAHGGGRSRSNGWNVAAASPDSRELFASIAAGDQQPLAQLQTTHATDLALGRLAAADRPALWRLARWADDGHSDILRVNAAGVLAKTGDLEFAGLPAAVLGRDRDVKTRYLRAMVARVGRDTNRLCAEVQNPADSGARWCAAWLLARDGSAASRRALTTGTPNRACRRERQGHRSPA